MENLFVTLDQASDCAKLAPCADKVGDWVNAIRNANLLKDEGKYTWRVAAGYRWAKAWEDGPQVQFPALRLELRKTTTRGSQVFPLAEVMATELCVPAAEAKAETQWETRLSCGMERFLADVRSTLALLSDACKEYKANKAKDEAAKKSAK